MTERRIIAPKGSPLAGARCKSCGARIIWAVSATTGALMPVDFAPSEHGTIALEPDGNEWVGRSVRSDEARTGLVLRKSHFATCPNGAQHRRPRRG